MPNLPLEADIAAESQPVLLLVDDEPNVLSALRRQLRSEGYRIVTAAGAAEALELLAREPVNVIVTDQQMPAMTGIEFLAEARRHYPDPVRMVLTGQADLNVVSEAVNKGAIYKFMVKPWEAESLRANLREAFQHHDLMRERARLDEEIRRANQQLRSVNRALEEQVAQRTRQLMRIAQYDHLTGLPNRLLLTDRLDQTLARGGDKDEGVAVMIVGLDRFKLINETYGHVAGDEVLRTVAERVLGLAPRTGTVARFGGDEFAVVLPELATVHDAVAFAEAVQKVLGESVFIGGEEIFVAASIGISIYPQDGLQVEALLQHADTAMHHAKEAGGRSFQFYAEQMNRRAVRRLTLEKELRAAVERNEFELYYQPQTEISSRRIVGVEALLRWRHPVRGVLAPAEFMPVLEDSGLIEPVGEWVFRQACTLGRAWYEQGLRGYRLAVNLSARQFDSQRLVDMVRRILEETKLDPQASALELEVTESMVLRSLDRTAEMLAEFRDMGVHIAVDDFGTGYASLSYLTRLPIQTLKIDRTFVQRMINATNDANVVVAIIALAHGIGLRVVAEGVETEQQLEFLKTHGCDEMQGYLFCEPQPAEEITRLLQLDQQGHEL